MIRVPTHHIPFVTQNLLTHVGWRSMVKRNERIIHHGRPAGIEPATETHQKAVVTSQGRYSLTCGPKARRALYTTEVLVSTVKLGKMKS